MPSSVINSGNIGTFSWKVTFDIYNRQIIFDTSATTYQGSGASGVHGISFSLVDQAGIPLLSIDWTSPQLPTPGTQPVYTFDASNIDFDFLFQAYTIIGAIQDGNGNTYSTVPIIANICEPPNITESGYVPGMFELRADCTNNILTVKEFSLLVYNNLQPIGPPSVSGTLYYPVGTISSITFSSTPFQNNQVYTGQYGINNTTIATYYLGNDVYVLVTYLTQSQWDFTCSNKIADLLCCISDLYRTKAANCDNAIGRRAAQQLEEIEIPFFAGLAQEMNGQDATWAYEIIKKKLNCNCGQNAIGQNQVTPINPSVYSIVITGVGGTTVTGGAVIGNTKTYVVGSKVYQVTKGNPSDPAFTIGTNTSVPNTVQYPITFNYLLLAQAIYTATASDPATLQQLNNLIQAFGLDLTGLNGSCIIDLTQSTYTASQVTTNLTQVVNIVINGNIYTAPTGLFAQNTSAFQSWLNSLSLGTFVVSLNSGTVNIVSSNNTNAVSTITFTSPNVTIQFQKTNHTLVQILQAIVDYICDISALEIELGAALSLQYFNYNGQVVTQNFSPDNNTQNDFNQAISQSIQSIISRMQSVTGVTCASLENIFNDSPNISWGLLSRAYGTDGNGNCVSWTDLQLANMFIAAVNKYSSVKTAWCAIDCSVPGTCPDITGLNLSALGQTVIGFYGVTWNSTPSANQIVTVRFRVHGTTTWMTASSNVNLFPNGNINGTSPFQIGSLTSGTTYDIWVTNNCGGNGFVSQVTTTAVPIVSGSFLLGNVIYSICGGSTTILYSSTPFGTGVQMFTDAGLTIPVTGFSLIVNSAGNIYNINSSTGVVGANTGSSCSSGTPGTYMVGNAIPGVCTNPPVTYYTNGAFATGLILYQDSALTTPVTGNVYVVNAMTNHIFNLNSSTGLIGSDTGTQCTGTATLTFSFINAGGGSFLSFAAGLSRAIDANVNINLIASNGYSSPGCGGGSVASAVNNTTWTILAGSTGNSISPSSTSGSWASASHYSVFDVTVNGVSHSNGDVVTIGSFSVTLVIPSCV